MTLRRAEPGVWADDGWTAGTPGTFALIIGVSAYKHLAGGPEQVPRTYGLSQLAVSALTAFRFFQWLREGYAFAGAPLARCWLLLAPTAAERVVGPISAADHAPADYASIRSAVGSWFGALEALGAAAQGSRAFVFFSGHGLEVTQERQVLLPSDYLSPPLGQVNDALSTENLRFAMRRVPLRDQFLFVDACRNGAAAMGTTVVEGNRILNEAGTDANLSIGPALLYATSSGSQAWQQPTPDRGLSLFGQALIDGLGGGVPPRDDDPPAAVWFNDLSSYAGRRVRRLLREAGVPEEQPVISAGADARISQPVRKGGPGRRGEWRRLEAELSEPTVDVDEAVNAPRGDVVFHPGWDLHACTGSEQIEQIWRHGARLLDLNTGEDLGQDRLTPVGGERLGVVRHWFVIAPELRAAGWLEIWDGQALHAALLPGVHGARFEIAMHWAWPTTPQAPPTPPRLATLDVDLAPGGAPSLDRAADLWRRYRRLDAATAAQALTEEDLDHAEHIVQSKTATPQSPLGAVVAALILLRAAQLDRLHDWLANLTRWFPDLPDAPALWAEQLARQGKHAPAQAALDALLQLTDRPCLPFTGDAFGYALGLADILLHTTPEDHALRPQLEHLHHRLSRVAPLTSPGGLLLTLTGPRDHLKPELVRT